jgi:hypothetical protein
LFAPATSSPRTTRNPDKVRPHFREIKKKYFEKFPLPTMKNEIWMSLHSFDLLSFLVQVVFSDLTVSVRFAKFLWIFEKECCHKEDLKSFRAAYWTMNKFAAMSGASALFVLIALAVLEPSLGFTGPSLLPLRARYPACPLASIFPSAPDLCTNLRMCAESRRLQRHHLARQEPEFSFNAAPQGS